MKKSHLSRRILPIGLMPNRNYVNQETSLSVITSKVMTLPCLLLNLQ